MASTPGTTIVADAVAQSPSFISLWIGNNDVLGFATSGGDGSNPITDQLMFEGAYNGIINTLTMANPNLQGVVANIPNVTDIPHFTTVPHNPLDPTNPDFGPQIPTLNSIFGALNQIYDAVGQPERKVEFSTTGPSAVIINDESLTDISGTISGALLASPTFPAFLQQFGLPAAAAPLVANLLGNAYGQSRQATANDLLVLPSSAVIGTVNSTVMTGYINQGLPAALAGQFSVEGVSLALEDKWVLLPSEQLEIKTATDGFNATISTAASNAGFALMDANSLLNLLKDGNLPSGNYSLNSNLVTGGAFSLDGVHPTSRGYALLANEFLKAIDTKYGSNFEASGNLVDIGLYNTNYSPGLQ